MQRASSRTKFKESLGVSVPGLLILGAWIAGRLAGSHTWWHLQMSAAAVAAGVPIVKEAWRRLRHRQFSIPLLITVASVGAFWIGEVWEAAAVTFLYRFGSYLEGLTMNRTRAALRELLEMRPQTARVQDENGEWIEAPADRVKPGQMVMVRPGDRVPVDGVVKAGQAALDTAALTGEPLPKEVAPGDRVLSGSISTGGYLEIEAERAASDSTFNRLLRLVAAAQNQKPKVQRFLDRFAQWYTPAVMAAAAGILIAFQDLRLALTFLVIGCPGALVVAAPVAVVAGLGRAARMGVLIKGGERLEQVARIDTVAFDKTGTLTQGRPAVSWVQAFGADPADVIQAAATAEARSEHHLATAILQHAETEGIRPGQADSWALHPGLGVEAHAGGEEILVGNLRLMESRGVEIGEEQRRAAAGREARGDALAYVAVGRRMIGLIAIHDPVRPEAAEMIARLRQLGLKKTVMLTGDHQAAADRVARELGIDEVRAGLLPEEKVEAIQQLRSLGHAVAMAGDGINDAPALAAADVSVAMGMSGTQAAVETADIVLVEDRLDRIPAAFQLSRRILGVVRQNVAIAVATVLILLAGVVTRHVGLSLGMLVHEASVLAVIFNGMRLLRAAEGLKEAPRPGRLPASAPARL